MGLCIGAALGALLIASGLIAAVAPEPDNAIRPAQVNPTDPPSSVSNAMVPSAPFDGAVTDALLPEPMLVPPKLSATSSTGVEWCQTEVRWRAKAGVHGGPGRAACPTEGSCDTPSVRDSWIPDGGTPILLLRIKFNVFRNSDGSNPAATQADVNAQMVQLNSDYLPSRIQFTATTEFIDDTTYRGFADSEEVAMKTAYADSPGTQLNVYVVNIEAGYLGVGTFAWDSNATGTLGGLIIDDDWFGAGEKTLTHEAGHCIGLWHTHHGVSEVAQCSDCWERADGLNGDTTGDFASDTAPTPMNFNCAPPGGTDPCSSTAWGATDPQNYMGYAPDSCYTEFSTQQDGRQHCWADAELTAWRATGLLVTPPGDLDTTGPAGGPFTPNSIVYTLENENATPIDYSVTKSQSWVSLSNTGGTLAGLGSATVTVSINSNADSLPAGGYADTVNFINTTDHDGDTTRDVTLIVGPATIRVEIMTDDYPSETTWTVEDRTSGDTVASGGPLANANYLYSENVYVVAAGCYDFTIFDSYGDGICCGWGNGYYSVYFEDTLVGSGGAFASSETISEIGGCTGPGPSGACCSPLGVCIGDIPEVDCAAAGGSWSRWATCGANPTLPTAVCSTGCTFNNGGPLDDFGAPASQYAPDYPFGAGAADDFILLDAFPGNLCRIDQVTVWTTHWNGPASPDLYQGVNVTIYANSETNGPGGQPENDGSHGEYFTGGVVYTEFVPMTSVTVTQMQAACTADMWQLDIQLAAGAGLELEKNVTYWLEVQPIMPFTDVGQSAVSLADTNHGQSAQQIFEAAGIPLWAEIEGNADGCSPDTPSFGSRRDIAFILSGYKNTTCGDGVVEGAEQCDDGNTVDGDGCDSNCTDTGCGNGIVTAGEECDDGNTADCDGCRGDCSGVETGCGDGFVCGAEVCDDGNNANCDGCRGDCSAVETGCGDGFVCGAEVCDDGNTADCDACRGDCSAVESTCGDGTLDPVCEACDDGNNVDCDGCRGDCSAVEGACGDGTVDTVCEACDDNNTGDEDGCSSTCTVEDGFECTGQPSVCVPICDDGMCIADEDRCSCPADCGLPPASEVPWAMCNDGEDNDCDTFTDCDDPDCAVRFGDIVAPFCPPTCPQPLLEDITCILDGFSAGRDWATVCPLADLASVVGPPCGADGRIDLTDILAGLSAFEGHPPCPGPCP